VLDVDRDGKIRLSRKAAMAQKDAEARAEEKAAPEAAPEAAE
jgi:predicted RNA-binding protein with RPS1 domain